MDSVDDDFGEVYVDAEVQASVPVAGDVGFVNSSVESEIAATISDHSKGFEDTVEPESQGETKKFGAAVKDSSPCVDDCAVNRTEESEYSESESDDDLNIVVKDDDSIAVNNGVEASQLCSFQKPWAGNWSTRPNGRMVNGGITMETSADNVYIDPSLGVLQCGYNISHTWSRMNLDVFEKKPWRNPGSDVNDFFNFGFNEETWKDYCKPLGKAIEVRGGNFERIPSAELRPPRDSDPDVVIQIPVTNDVEKLSSEIPVEAKSPSLTPNEGSRSEDLSSSNDSVKEEALGCQGENTESSSGEQSPPKENCSSREVTPCDKEMVGEEKEENRWNSDDSVPSSVERETSLGDRIRFSPTPSCSVGKSEESENSETESSKGSDSDDQREVFTPPRRARCTKDEAISMEAREKSGTMQYGDRRSHEDTSSRHFRRVDYAVQRRTEHRVVKDASPSADPELGKKVRLQHGNSYRDSSKNWQNRPLYSFNKDETEGKGFPHSNRENYHGRSHSSVDRDRHRDRRFDWHNNEESSFWRVLDHSNGYKYDTHLKEYTSRSSFNLNQRNSGSRCREEEDRYVRQHCERKYSHEGSQVLPHESNRERNRYDWLREPHSQDRIPIADMDYKYQSEYSFAHGRHNPRQSHENDLHSRRRGDYNCNVHRHRYEDEVHRAESGIPFELAYREMPSFDEVGRREFQMYERNEEFSELEERHRYTPDWHLDRFVPEKDGYKHRVQDAWPSQSVSLRDSWYTKGARDDSWRADTRDFKRTERYDRQNNQWYKTLPRDGWTRNLGHRDNVSIQDRLTYEDDWIVSDRERYKVREDIQCSMREVIHSEYPSYADETLVRDIRMPVHNRMSTKQRYGYLKNHINESDERHHRSKKPRVGGNAFINYQDPENLTGRRGKLPNQSKRRFSNGGDTIQQQDHQKPRKVVCKSNEKTVKMHNLSDKEEGEIIEETRQGKGSINKERIQESLLKMEKRRERFKEAEFASAVVATITPGAKSNDTDLQRPIRKRRWCAS